MTIKQLKKFKIMNIHLDTYPKDINKTPLETCFFYFWKTADGGVCLWDIYTTKRNDKLLSYDEVLKLERPVFYLNNKRKKKIGYKTIKGMFNKLTKELNDN